MFPVEKEVHAGSQLTDSVLQCEHKFEKKKNRKKKGFSLTLAVFAE